MSKHFDRLVGLAAGAVSERASTGGRTDGVRQVPLLIIDLERLRPDQTNVRTQLLDEDIEQIAASMQELGQQTPIQVRWSAADGVYVIKSGNTRYAAAKRIGMTSLRAELLDEHLTDDQLAVRQVAENTARRDLQPLDVARGMQAMLDRGSVTQEQLARQLGRSQSWVSRQLALLRLPAAEQAKVAAGTARMTEARAQVVKRPRGRGRGRPEQICLRADGIEVTIVWRKASARGTAAAALETVRPLAEQADSQAGDTRAA